MKCSNTIISVAWIKFVIDDISYCLFREKSYFIVLLYEWYLQVSRNVVMKVVRLKIEFDTSDRIQARFPNSSLNRFVPVRNTVFRLY